MSLETLNNDLKEFQKSKFPKILVSDKLNTFWKKKKHFDYSKSIWFCENFIKKRTKHK